nr:HTH domain-containing protein [Candidatus Erwinia dacicola]
MSIRAIARQLSCSRETVRRYIRSPLPGVTALSLRSGSSAGRRIN